MLNGQRKYKGEKMFKEFSVENWIIGGTCFLIVFTLGCYFWFHSVMASIDEQYTDRNVGVEHLEKTSEMSKIKTKDTIEQKPREKNRSETNDTLDGISGITNLMQFERKSENPTFINQSQMQLLIKDGILLDTNI